MTKYTSSSITLHNSVAHKPDWPSEGVAACLGITYDTTMADVPVVVGDTNVPEAAMRGRDGASFALLSLIGTGRFEIALYVPLVSRVQRKCSMCQAGTGGRDPTAIANLLDYLCAVGKCQSIFYLWRPCLPDPGDDMVLEIAVAGPASRRDCDPQPASTLRPPYSSAFASSVQRTFCKTLEVYHEYLERAASQLATSTTRSLLNARAPQSTN